MHRRASLASHASRRHSAGLSLIEMMVATVVSGVLASVAYPSYAHAVQKLRRSEALVTLMQVQQAEERFRSGASRYGALDELGLTALPGHHYALTIDAATADGYEASVVATGAQTRDRHCRVMKVAVDGGAWTTASGPTAAAENDAQANRRCWNQ